MSRAGFLIRNTLRIPRSPGPVPYRSHAEVKRIASRLISTSAMAADVFTWEREAREECERVFLHLEEYGDTQGPSLEAALEAASIAEAGVFLALTRSMLGDEEAKENALVAAAVALDSGILHGRVGSYSLKTSFSLSLLEADVLSVASLLHKTGASRQCEELSQHVRVAASDPATRAQARFLIKTIRKAERRAAKSTPAALGPNLAAPAAEESSAMPPRLVFGSPAGPAQYGARRKSLAASASASSSSSSRAVFGSEDVREKRKAQGSKECSFVLI